MEYLVLQRFNSMGKLHLKGTIVDEEFIRSPRLRISEGKIIPAVSSSEVPIEADIEDDVTSAGTKEELIIDDNEDDTEDDTEDETEDDTEDKSDTKPVFKFKV